MPAYRIVGEAPTEHRERMKQLLIKHLGEAAQPSTAVIDTRGAIILIRKGTPTLSELRRLLREVE